MWFRKITAGAFGHLRDEGLNFGKALNIVYGPNESGKSTWHAALVVALCGRRHGSGRTNAERDFKRRRQPWDDPDHWQVTLELALDDGRIIEIDRDLRVPSTRVLDIGVGGRKVTDDLMNQGSPDGSKWLGLDRTTFPITASVSQADILSILDLRRRERKTERDALQESLAQAAAGGAGGTAAGAIERIRKFSTENVGLDRRNSRRPLRLAIDGVKRAERQLSRTQERRQEYVELARRVDRYRRRVRDLEDREAALKASLASDEAEIRASQLTERATRLTDWERQFPEGDPRILGEENTADLVVAISGAQNAPESVGTDLDPLEALEGRLRELDQQQELVEAFEGLDETEKQADELTREVERLQEWERRFVDGNPRALEEISTADLVIAIRRAQSAPESVGTDLDPLEALEDRLEELGLKKELVEDLEDLEEAERRAEELERKVERLEEWEQRFLDADPRNRELMSFADMASAVARCNSLPTSGFTDLDPLDNLEERIGMLDASPPKPCPSPGDVQRWVIPLRENPPPQQELQSQVVEARRIQAPTETGLSGWRVAMLTGFGVVAAAGVWMVTTELLYGISAGVLVALGLGFLRVVPSKQRSAAPVALQFLERQLRERETFDARVVEAHRLLHEWELPLDPDAAIAEFYNRERAWSEQTSERRRLEEMVARRRRFDDEEAKRKAERVDAFAELRRVLSLYGGDASGDEGQVLGESTYLLSDLQRVARERQQDVAEWGRFQEALGDRSVEAWRVEAESSRQYVDLARRRVEEMTAKVHGKTLETKTIDAERLVTEEMIFRRRRFDEEEARRSLAREEAFEELRSVVVSYGGDGSGDEGELLRVAVGLLGHLEGLAEQRQEDVAEWGRFQEALGGLSVEEWQTDAAHVKREARELRRKAKELSAGLEGELLGSNNIRVVLERSDRQLREARKEASRAAGQLEQISTDRVDVATAKATVEKAKSELAKVQRLQSTLDTAREYLQRAAERAHRLLAPRLEALMTERIPFVTGGRYVDAFVDPETLEVKLRHMDGMIREAALLSHGTAEQVYLLLRIILAQVLTDGHEPCPVLLDDPTVHADPERKEQVLEYLLQSSNDHQVILFTQDQLVVQWASARRSHQKTKLLKLPIPL